MNTILSAYSASVSELKKNPSQLLELSGGEPIAILNHNKPSAYLVPAQAYEEMLNQLEDIELSRIIESRKSEKSSAISVSVDEL